LTAQLAAVGDEYSHLAYTSHRFGQVFAPD
jgi:hypothetical protein